MTGFDPNLALATFANRPLEGILPLRRETPSRGPSAEVPAGRIPDDGQRHCALGRLARSGIGKPHILTTHHTKTGADHADT